MKLNRIYELLNFPEKWYQWVVMYICVMIIGLGGAYGIFFLLSWLFKFKFP